RAGNTKIDALLLKDAACFTQQGPQPAQVSTRQCNEVLFGKIAHRLFRVWVHVPSFIKLICPCRSTELVELDIQPFPRPLVMQTTIRQVSIATNGDQERALQERFPGHEHPPRATPIFDPRLWR